MGGELVDLILARRSIKRLAEPAPTPEELRIILRAAAAAPDHGELRPWRFIVLTGAGKDAFGAVLADAYVERCAAGDETVMPAKREKERTKLGRAPLVLVVAAVRVHGTNVTWDDQLGSAYAAAQNALLAATALGYGSMWRTGPPTCDPNVKRALGLRDDDAIVGFLYIGTPDEGGWRPPHDPDLDGLVVQWQPEPGD